MILKAPQTFINYVEKSAHFLNCPNQIFNEDLNATYRQFVLLKTEKEVIIHIANVLYTFGYTKKKAYENAKELYHFYYYTTMKIFNRLNVSSFINGVPKRLLDKSKEIDRIIESRKSWYWNGVQASQGYYNFTKGYKLKEI